MKKIFALLPVLALCALLCTCSKDRLSPLEQLPPITSKGANTFGCLLNGQPIIFTSIKEISGAFLTDSDSSGQLPFDSCDIWLIFKNEKHNINLFLTNPIVNFEWSLNKNTYTYPIISRPKDYIMVDGFISSEGTQGFFKSSDLNTTKPIFSGTFEFDCINPRTCQTMKVTNGRLDVNLNQLQ